MELERILKEKFGYESFREGQKEVIESILNGRDTFALLPTGKGKSLCYQLPAYLIEGTVLIISPLLSLMQDQVEQLKKMGEKRVAALNSFLSKEDKQFVWQHISQFRFLFLSPEMLSSHNVREKIQQLNLSLIVVDEAHCISQWGFDFRPEYLQIANAMPKNRPPILALSATATTMMTEDISTYLKMNDMNILRYSVDRPNLHYEVVEVEQIEKQQKIIEQIEQFEGPGILYTQSRKKAEKYAEALVDKQIRCAFYHAGMEQEDRRFIQQQFLSGQLDWICATNAFGMGVHKENVRQIIHDYIPSNVASYMQEVGRAGRDGEDALCTIYVESTDWTRTLEVAMLDLPQQWQIDEFLRYAQSGFKTELLVSEGKLSETTYRVLSYWMHHLSPEDVLNKVQQLANMKKQQLSELVHILKGSCIRQGLLQYFDEEKTVDIVNCCSSCGLIRNEILNKHIATSRSKELIGWKERIHQLLPTRMN